MPHMKGTYWPQLGSQPHLGEKPGPFTGNISQEYEMKPFTARSKSQLIPTKRPVIRRAVCSTESLASLLAHPAKATIISWLFRFDSP